MKRLARFDISRRIGPPSAQRAAQVAFGVACVGGMILVRGALDLVALSAGPFALVYPTIVLATLYGHWRGGLTAYVLAFLWAWFVVLPERWSFAFAGPDDAARTIINALAALVVLIVPEAFRSAAASSREEAERALERLTTLLAELEHRTKNNFALVASLLEIQKRRQDVPGLHEALDDAAGRVRAFAEAYSSLASEQPEGAEVAMKPYLERLLARVARASFGLQVTVESAIGDMQLPREVGVGIGLFLNEALANAAKYAFPDGRPGRVLVAFAPIGHGWELTIEDDGRLTPAEAASSGGLGKSLMAAFATQARAEHLLETGRPGYRHRLFSLRGSRR